MNFKRELPTETFQYRQTTSFSTPQAFSPPPSQSPSTPPSSAPDLRNALRRARDEALGQAASAPIPERGPERLRLENLRAHLEPLLSSAPDDLFELGLTHSAPHRLFIDAVAFVEIALGTGFYQFILMTRGGRATLAQAATPEEIAHPIMNYAGRRLMAREQALLMDEIAYGQAIAAHFKNAQNGSSASAPPVTPPPLAHSAAVAKAEAQTPNRTSSAPAPPPFLTRVHEGFREKIFRALLLIIELLGAATLIAGLAGASWMIWTLTRNPTQ